MKKILLMGSENAGKSSMHSVIFANLPVQKNVLSKIAATNNKEEFKHKFMGNLTFSLWDCGGQQTFMDGYFETNEKLMFEKVGILIYVFDSTLSNQSDLEIVYKYWRKAVTKVKEYNENASVFVLCNKMDLIPIQKRDEVISKKKEEIFSICEDQKLKITQFFATSIWDESLYQAWSRIVQEMIPNKHEIYNALKEICETSMAQEAALFEKSTFLTLGYYHKDFSEEEQRDVSKYEKIANIVKQFKITCRKYANSIEDVSVSSDSFNLLITEFTRTENIMVVYKKRSAKAAIAMNIKAKGKQFSLSRNM